MRFAYQVVAERGCEPRPLDRATGHDDEGRGQRPLRRNGQHLAQTVGVRRPQVAREMFCRLVILVHQPRVGVIPKGSNIQKLAH